MHRITIQRTVPKHEMPTVTQLKQWAREVLKRKESDIEMTIRIVDTAEMTTLNTQYRRKSGPTNVLSFPYDEPPLLGDIVICAEVVNREANEQEKTSTAHWAHMVVHGTLHLLGYDHEIPRDADEMESIEIAILNELGFANPYKQGK